MIKSIKNFFKRSKFQILELSVEDIEGNELLKILNKEISGIVLKNFFEKEKEISIDFSRFNIRETPFGFTTGLSIFNSNSDLSDYFSENTEYNNQLLKSLDNINYQQRLEYVFSKIFGNKKVEVYNSKKTNKYKISTLRVIEPNKEGIQKHIGNEFMFNFEQTKSIREDTINLTQFSFFSLLQSPEIGGKLILFNKLWKDTPKSLVQSGSLINKRYQRTNFLKNCETISIEMEKGDLLIFDGGRIWHKVSSVKGLKSRITVGGFLAINKNKDTIYYWS